MSTNTYVYPTFAKVLHMGMAVFGIAAFLTGELAENGLNSIGYLLHAYLGLSLLLFIMTRWILGFTAHEPMSFSGWSPFQKSQWNLAAQDLRNLMQLKVPDRGMHQGLSGLTQAFGLVVFAWMAITGTGLFLLNTGIESGLFEFVEEIHEIGEALIPLYLALHVGSVIVHLLDGKPIWKRMWVFWK